jgi:hypothetical protein
MIIRAIVSVDITLDISAEFDRQLAIDTILTEAQIKLVVCKYEAKISNCNERPELNTNETIKT